MAQKQKGVADAVIKAEARSRWALSNKACRKDARSNLACRKRAPCISAVRSRTCSLRIMFRDLSHTAWARGISQSYTLPTSFQSPCPPLCPSLYAHPSRSLPRSSTGILC
jgi:hypothetical protein